MFQGEDLDFFFLLSGGVLKEKKRGGVGGDFDEWAPAIMFIFSHNTSLKSPPGSDRKQGRGRLSVFVCVFSMPL